MSEIVRAEHLIPGDELRIDRAITVTVTEVDYTDASPYGEVVVSFLAASGARLTTTMPRDRTCRVIA